MDCREEYFDNDPRSYAYIRKHLRPKINIYYVLMNVAISLLFFIVLEFILNSAIIKIVGSQGAKILFVIILILYIILELKYVVIFLIKIYQRLAPEYMRDKCRFEPSCSNYMLLSIRKHGFLKGFIKGVNRLKRCNINDGGFDRP